MPDYLIDFAIAALLRLLTQDKERSKWRRAMLKVFQAIARAYEQDDVFKATIDLVKLPTK